jgi:type IV pilus assembly protein PilW
MMTRHRERSFFQQTGFTLVELMVGLAIGMFATLVIMQVLSIFEMQKRTTTGVADAQTNGSIALYTLSHDLQMAGWGLHPAGDPSAAAVSATDFSPLRCGTAGGTLTVDGAANIDSWNLFPVAITDGGAAVGASDSIIIRYGDSMKGGIPAKITLPAGNPVTVANNLACQVNDRVLLFDANNNCAMTSVTALTGTTGVTLGNAALATPDTNLSCLGNWNQTTYSVSSVNDVSAMMRNGAANVTDIVNIQAQYGISAAVNSNQINQWVDATWATAVNRNRIRAVRIAVVARNPKTEMGNVTFACSSTTTANPSGLCAWDATSANPAIASPAPAINLSNDANGTSWQRYRYRVFETIIPLRNLIWTRSTL